MKKFYSASTNGFYIEEIHGSREIQVMDLSWSAAQIESPSSGENGGTLIIDEPDNPPKSIIIENPDCLIPADAVEISNELHMKLLEAQSNGKRIQPDKNGFPIVVDPPPPSVEQLAATVRVERDRRIAATDWTQAVDIPDATKLLWQPYRKALRDVPGQPDFPEIIDWPDLPA